MKYLLSFILVLFLNYSIAQQNSKQYFPSGMVFSTKKDVTTSIKGSIFFHEEWENGSFYTFKNEKIENVKLRINLYHHQIQVKIKNKIKATDNKNVKIIEVGNKKYYTSYNFKMADNNIGIFELLYTENLKLAKLFYIKKTKANYKVQTNAGEKEDSYNLKELIYLIIDNEAYKIPKSSKALANLFGNKSNDMLKFIKSEKIKTKKNDDLIKVLKYYNSLLKFNEPL